MDSNKGKIIIGVILALVIGLILYYIVTYEEDYFDEVVLPETPYVTNSSDIAYLDTIVAVGIQELGLSPTVVRLRSMSGSTRPPSADGMKTEAYIIGNDRGQYLIVVDKMNRSDAIKIIAHELIHLKQYESGDLTMDMKKNSITWKGIEYTYEELPPYSQREWEYEAEREAVELRKQIKAILYKD